MIVVVMCRHQRDEPEALVSNRFKKWSSFAWVDHDASAGVIIDDKIRKVVGEAGDGLNSHRLSMPGLDRERQVCENNAMAAGLKIVTEVVFLGRDRATATFQFDGRDSSSPIKSIEFNASGCSEFLHSLEDFKNRVMALPAARRMLNGSRDFELLISPGADHVSVLIREMILRAREKFALPYADVELCHCRAVPTEVVDRAIISGCHTVQSVARMTSAGTSCGTCKPDTESLIAYRLKGI